MIDMIMAVVGAIGLFILWLWADSVAHKRRMTDLNKGFEQTIDDVGSTIADLRAQLADERHKNQVYEATARRLIAEEVDEAIYRNTDVYDTVGFLVRWEAKDYNGWAKRVRYYETAEEADAHVAWMKGQDRYRLVQCVQIVVRARETMDDSPYLMNVPYRADYDGEPGVVWRGPLSKEFTWLADNPRPNFDHAHCSLDSPHLVIHEALDPTGMVIPEWVKSI